MDLRCLLSPPYTRLASRCVVDRNFSRDSLTNRDRRGIMEYALGDIAQLVEHFNGIEGVSGSNPLISISQIAVFKLQCVGIQL